MTTFYLDEAATGFLTGINVFWGNVGNRFPGGITWSTSNTGDLIDVATGALTGTWTDGVASSVNSSGTGAYAAGVGTRVRWSTSGVRNGRRVRGSMFLVPLTTACYQADGSIDGAVLGSLQTSVSALYSALSPEFSVWSRPSGGQAGQASVVTGSSIPDRVSWLRSRRT